MIMNINQGRVAHMIPQSQIQVNDANLDSAAHCHICFKAPIRTFEAPIFPYPARQWDVVLRCPLDHGNVALGHTTKQAVELWNAYIESRMREAHQLRSAIISPNTHNVVSACPHCLTHTRSILHREGHEITQECAECHLTKSMKEID